MFFRDPFKLVPVSSIADIADKFTRNEILSSNEVRGLIGFKPSSQPGADELRNKNINQASSETESNSDNYVETENADEDQENVSNISEDVILDTKINNI